MVNVSIVLPAFNCEDTIKDTIQSVLKQNYKNFELIIINDGSIDKTEDICKEFLKLNSNIKYLKINNSGVGVARNKGIEIATGKYITFIDSDDLYSKNYLKKLVNEIEKSDYDIIMCGFTTFGEINRIYKYTHEFTVEKPKFNTLIQKLQKKDLFNQMCSKIFILNNIKNNNIKFDENLDLGEDYRFNIDYLRVSNKIKYIQEVGYLYRIKEEGLNFKYRKNRNKIDLENLKYLEKYYLENKFSTKYIKIQYIKIILSGIKYRLKYLLKFNNKYRRRKNEDWDFNIS